MAKCGEGATIAGHRGLEAPMRKRSNRSNDTLDNLFSRVHEGDRCIAALLPDVRAALPLSMRRVQDETSSGEVGDVLMRRAI